MEVDAPIDAPSAITLTVPAHPTDATTYKYVVAFQDGDGPWTLAPAPVGDDYLLPIVSDRYGVLVTCSGLWQRQGGASIVQTEYFTRAETTRVQIDLSACGDPRVLGRIEGTVSNAGVQNPVGLAVDDFLSVRSGGGSYSLPAPLGKRDVIASQEGAYQIDRMLIERDLQVASTTPLNVDFVPAVATEQHTLIADTLASDERLSTFNYFTTANGTRVRMSGGGQPDVFYSAPAALRRPGDFDWLDATVSRSLPALTMAFRRFQLYGTATTNITATWRAPLAIFDCSLDMAKRAHFSWSATAADRYYVYIYIGSVFRYTGVSKGYLGAATSWVEPDLSAITDWPATYDLPPVPPNQYAGCGLEVLETANGPAEFASSRHADGVSIRSSQITRNFTP